MAEFTLQALHDEIENDPNTIGYKEVGGEWKGDPIIAGLINDTANGATITRKLIEPKEIFDSIPFSEYEAYSQAKRDWLDTALELAGGSGVIDGTDSVVWANLLAIFPAGSDARTNIVAKIQRTGTRAEVLWGDGITITTTQIGEAANL